MSSLVFFLPLIYSIQGIGEASKVEPPLDTLQRTPRRARPLDKGLGKVGPTEQNNFDNT